jgi:hypothetical protein
LGKPERAEGLHCWLPGLGTFGAQRASFPGLDCHEATIVRMPNKAVIVENLLF